MRGASKTHGVDPSSESPDVPAGTRMGMVPREILLPFFNLLSFSHRIQTARRNGILSLILSVMMLLKPCPARAQSAYQVVRPYIMLNPTVLMLTEESPVKVPQKAVVLQQNSEESNETTDSAVTSESPYLRAVREFADNVLKYGRDTYGPKHTPLFVDGLNVNTHEPVKWISPKGGDPLIATETEEWILSNFADQQTLLRTLDGLSTLTGDPKYRNAAMQATKYFFENLVAPNGLFYWGQCTAYDAQGDRVHFIEPKDVHSLKLHYPYYELMWQTDRNITKKFIEAYWSTHILDWSNLDMNRSSLYSYSFEEPWNHDYKSGPAFFEGKGIAFIRTASSLVYSAVFLYTKLGQEQPLTWSKRLVKRYVDTRHPNTGISAVLYNQITYPLGDDLREHFRDPRTVLFPYDIAKNTEFYYPEKTHAQAWIAFLLVNEMLGIKDSEFAQWILEELTAWGKVAYRKKDNVFIPMLTDGTSLEGYVVKEDAFLGQKGDVIRPYVVDLTFLWAYSVAYRLLGDEFMWSMVRDIAQGNNFGDIGESPTSTPKLRSKTNCSDVYGLLSFLDLYAKTKKPEFLSIAQRIADNILDTQFSKGFFVLSKDHVYSRFDSLEPLALLRLVAALKHQQELVPRVWPSSPLSVGPYRYKEKGIDRQIIYTLRELFEPPLSLQEAAAIGDIKLIKSLVAQGEGVGRREDPFVKTALHRAVISNHQNIVEFLLSQGAPINAKDAYMATPLHYALERRNNEIVKLLIKNNADVAVRDGRGRTPVDIAISNNNDDIKKLLLAKAAETSIHAAVMLGDQEKVKAFLDQGSDVNVEDDKGNTPLFYAVRGSHDELAQFLIDQGADVNHKDKDGYIFLSWAIWNEDRDMIKILVTNGADVNLVVGSDWPFLHYLAWNNDRELVELFLAHGAKLNVKDKNGWTELHVAVSRGNRDLARFLVSKGATAPELHLAACLGDLTRVKSLVEGGGDVDTKDEAGWTPLHWVASMAEEEVAEFLISKGAGIDVRTNNNRTPLHQAATAGAVKLVNLLISKGAEVNARDEGNDTPLHSAAAGGHRDVVELLIANGADIGAKDNRGKTPLDLARQKGNTAIVEILTKATEEKKESSSKSPDMPAGYPLDVEEVNPSRIQRAA